MDRVILFGLGGKLEYEKEHNPNLFVEMDIVAYADNNAKLWGTKYDNKPVIAPNSIQDLEYDYVVILSKYYSEIEKQLEEYGVIAEKIEHWDVYTVSNKHGLKTEYLLNPSEKKSVNTVILITTALAINGGSLALLFAGEALKLKGYDVTICTTKCSEEIIKNINDKGMNLVVAPAIQYPNNLELEWIQQYDYVLINVLQMLRAACVISRVKPVLWWIHENSEAYSDTYQWVCSINCHWNPEDYNNIKVCPVTKKAAEVFNSYYPNKEIYPLALGIPDFNTDKTKNNSKIVCAVIGTIEPRKNQLLAIEAMSYLGSGAELWIVGKDIDSYYSDKVIDKVKKNSNVKIINELTRGQMEELYESIDIVLCSSLEETLSMTIIEGMMNKKICITSDATGIADYMTDGVDGYIFKSGDADDLKNKLEYVVRNWDKLDNVREAARKTYEENFTLEKFGERIVEIMKG